MKPWTIPPIKNAPKKAAAKKTAGAARRPSKKAKR